MITLEDPVRKIRLSIRFYHQIDGIILVPTSENPSKLEEISAKTPIVLIDRYFEKHNLPYVATDNYVGAYQTTVLLESGHVQILCIQEPSISITTKEHCAGMLMRFMTGLSG